MCMTGWRQWIAAAVAVASAAASNSVQAACAPLSNGNEPSLQSSFNTLLGNGVLNVANCATTDAAWVSDGSSSATILLELAGYEDTNRFGIYDPISGQRIQVFNGNADANAQKSITFTSVSGGYEVRVNGNYQTTFASQTIGFYLYVVGLDGQQSSDPYYYSDTALNGDGNDHMLAYQGTDTNFLSNNRVPSHVRGSLFDSNDYILAWEDLPNGGDHDYQDFVVLVRDITPVPLPAAVWLLATGLLGLAGIGRRGGTQARS